MIGAEQIKAGLQAVEGEVYPEGVDGNAVLDVANSYSARMLIRVLSGDIRGDEALGAMFAAGFDLGVRAARVEAATKSPADEANDFLDRLPE